MHITSPISQHLSNEQLLYLNNFFRDCPESFSSNLIYKRYHKHDTLISSGDACKYVYILLEGRLQAVEESVTDEPYNFTEIAAIDIIGDYELFQRIPRHMVTLTTLEDSFCLVIPANAYFPWIQHDANALFLRTQKLINQLSAQTRFERQNLFLDNETRLTYFFFTECTRQSGQSVPFQIAYTRPQIAQKLGCSIRTVNRNILSLKQEGLITMTHGKIYITKQQYLNLQEYLRCHMPGYR